MTPPIELFATQAGEQRSGMARKYSRGASKDVESAMRRRKKRDAQERQIAQEREKPQTGHRDRPLRGEGCRSEGTEEGREEEDGEEA